VTITKGSTMLIKGNTSGQRSLLTQAIGAATLAMMLAACAATSSTIAQSTSAPPPSGTPTAAAAASTAAASTAAASTAAASTAAASTAAATASTKSRASSSPPASSSRPAAAGNLSGTWTGQYSGASSGNFTLHCTQSGSALSGTVNLETDGISLPIHGTVAGDSIQFGTVGSTGISYQGTVSGNSMSGSYKLTANGTTFTGPWTAARSS
jgi:hypothetical protein